MANGKYADTDQQNEHFVLEENDISTIIAQFCGADFKSVLIFCCNGKRFIAIYICNHIFCISVYYLFKNN